MTEVFTESNGDRKGVNNVAIVLTDGRSSHSENSRFKDPVPMARAVESDGIMVYGVGGRHRTT